MRGDGAGPFVLVESDISAAYPRLVEQLRAEGLVYEKVKKYRIRELHPFLLGITDPTDRVLQVRGRLPNPGFLAAEAVWILSGSKDDWIFSYNRQLEAYTGREILGAYGPRLRRWRGHTDQLALAAERLTRKPGSQRVSVVIFDPEIDQTWHRNVPCTNLFRFMIRDGRLDMTTVMRAQDVWLGLPYDYFTFSLLHELMAGFAGAQVGTYWHFMDVLRLYEDNWEAAPGVAADARVGPPAPPAALAWPEFDRAMAELAEFARDPLCGELPAGLTPWWHGMALTLRSYRAFRAGDLDLAVDDCRRVEGPLRIALARWYDRYLPADSFVRHQVELALAG